MRIALRALTGPRLAPGAAALVAAALLVGCGRQDGGSTGHYSGAAVTHYVTIRKIAFDPATLDVAYGDTVAWENEDLVPHTVTARSGDWTSGNLPPGSRFRWVVAGRDSAPYFCTYHTTMHGVVRIGTRL